MIQYLSRLVYGLMQFFFHPPSDCPICALFVLRKDDNQRIRAEEQSERVRRVRAEELDTPVRTLIVINSFYHQQH